MDAVRVAVVGAAVMIFVVAVDLVSVAVALAVVVRVGILCPIHCRGN